MTNNKKLNTFDLSLNSAEPQTNLLSTRRYCRRSPNSMVLTMLSPRLHHSFILSDNIYLLNSYHVSSTALHVKDLKNKESDRVSLVAQFNGHGFDPWSGKIPCAGEQLCSSTTGIELVL